MFWAETLSITKRFLKSYGSVKARLKFLCWVKFHILIHCFKCCNTPTVINRHSMLPYTNYLMTSGKFFHSFGTQQYLMRFLCQIAQSRKLISRSSVASPPRLTRGLHRSCPRHMLGIHWLRLSPTAPFCASGLSSHPKRPLSPLSIVSSRNPQPRSFPLGDFIERTHRRRPTEIWSHLSERSQAPSIPHVHVSSPEYFL